MSQLKAFKKLVCILTAIFFALSSDAVALSKEPQGGTLILIEQKNDTSSGGPRSPGFNPFIACLVDGYVILQSDVPCGQASIVLLSAAGDFYSTVFDTAEGFILVPVSGEAGWYSLRIKTPSHGEFHGEFEI